MGGYKNCILRVNLTERRFSEEPLSEKLIHDYIGGRGFGAKLLYDDLKPNVDPLGEDNELIFLAGPLAGTKAQSFGRWKVFFKSPLTGTGFKSSGGGYFASELKFAGLDGIIVEGKSEKPVYLWLRNGHYEFRDATYLWGLNCTDTHTLIREELKDPRIRMACIGPSGEHGVKISGIFSDRRTAARGDGGAVMGSKNLKAIAIRGNGRVEPADQEAFAAAVKEQITICRNSPMFKPWSTRGTQSSEFTNVLGIFPTRNFREGVQPNWENIEGAEYDKLRVGKSGCYACILRCGSIAKTAKLGMYNNRTTWTEGPEYETIWAFSGPMGVADIDLTIAADSLCDNLGLDTISVGNVIGFAYELYERGIITKKDTGGIELTYGNAHQVLGLIEQIAHREGFGDILADGARVAARRIGKGAEEYAMEVKGLEMPGYDPRGAKSQGLSMLTTNIGADHNSGYANQEIFGSTVPKRVDRVAIEGKGELTKWNQDYNAMIETGIMCAFIPVLGMISPELYAKLISSVTGVKDFADPAYLWKAGERIFNLERMFNVREGFSKKDDVYPARFKEAMPSGPSAGQVFETETLLSDYYKARGWDPETGIPTIAKLKEWGMDFTVG